MTTNQKQTTQRLQTVLSQAGVASRRSAEILISEGKVFVNGEQAVLGQRVDPAQDKVSVNGKKIDLQREVLKYYLVYKPMGYVSTTSDELDRPTVLDVLPESARAQRLYPVGRLDFESEGLMLLTNDGDLTYKMTHPKFQIPKTYFAQLDRKPSSKALDHLRRGVRLKDGLTQPAQVEVASEHSLFRFADNTDHANWISITITEGRNRQVRRMIQRVGYDTQRLIRTKMGPLSLSWDFHSRPWYQVTSATL